MADLINVVKPTNREDLPSLGEVKSLAVPINRVAQASPAAVLTADQIVEKDRLRVSDLTERKERGNSFTFVAHARKQALKRALNKCPFYVSMVYPITPTCPMPK